MSGRRSLLARAMIRRTKREVTDPAGDPIFRRRQVHTQPFTLAPREREFYERLSDYLREGYTAAGVGKTRTTSKERAIGFVMVTFQKIMSSSPRAIRQALRRRRLVLLARKALEAEGRRRRGEQCGEEILKIQIPGCCHIMTNNCWRVCVCVCVWTRVREIECGWRVFIASLAAAESKQEKTTRVSVSLGVPTHPPPMGEKVVSLMSYSFANHI